MKNFFNVEWKDIDSAIDSLVNPRQFADQLSDATEEPVQRMIIKTLFSQLYSNAQKRRLEKDLAGIVIIDHEWNAKSDNSNYFDNAQFLANELVKLKPVRIFAGPSTASYMGLMSVFAPIHSDPIGIHLVGNFGNAEVFKAPTSVVPDNVIYIETDKSIIKYFIKGLRGSKE